MFSSIRMIFAVLLITGIAGAGMYVMKLRADNATLKANQIKLETAVEEQNKVLEQQKEDFTAILESNKKLNVLINTFKKDLQDAYDIGQDYAKHTSTITPGEPSYNGFENGSYTPSKPGSGEMVTKKNCITASLLPKAIKYTS